MLHVPCLADEFSKGRLDSEGGSGGDPHDASSAGGSATPRAPAGAEGGAAGTMSVAELREARRSNSEIDCAHKENYLADADFLSLFHLTKDQWMKQPQVRGRRH